MSNNKDKLDLDTIQLKFEPNNNAFTKDDIIKYKTHNHTIKVNYIIEHINKLIIDKVNQGKDSDGMLREYISVDFRIPAEVEKNFKDRGFRVNINESSHEEEIYSGGIRPDYMTVTDYNTVIAWDKL